MALDLKPSCERCAAAVAPGGGGFICSYECTFCQPCSDALGAVCPNCGGELVHRPRRVSPQLGGGLERIERWVRRLSCST
jgi:hypothetical protein